MKKNMIKITHEAIKKLDPTMINFIEILDANPATMMQIMGKLSKEYPDAAKQTIILSERVDIKAMNMRDLLQLRDTIDSVIGKEFENQALSIALKLLNGVLTERKNEKQLNIIYDRIIEFMNELRIKQKEIKLCDT